MKRAGGSPSAMGGGKKRKGHHIPKEIRAKRPAGCGDWAMGDRGKGGIRRFRGKNDEEQPILQQVGHHLIVTTDSKGS